ncbi:MAG TPA: gliding-motility protein MglA, partial [Candidatus Sabulitectum sp.]|nr:gliding-motility protein MglA [Candidatus Sabulitectum sp.]
MPHLDLENRQFIFKIVYFGPGMSGKTTNLLYIHRTLMEKYRGDMLVLDTEEERTLFFDFFPVSLGTVQGFSLKFHLYTIPGQVYYEASRRIILEGADGVVFVADSNTERLDDNLEMYRRMLDNLESYGVDPGSFPIVLQYNKRDFDDILPLGTLEEALELPDRIPVTSSVATTGRGVMQTL